MALPENVLATVTYNAPFLSPRDRTRSALRCWERGGLALNNATGGLNVYDWQFRADADTGEVYAGVPTAEGADTFTVAETLVYTIDPPPREIAGSFDTNMQPIIAWRNDDGAFFRWFDPVANDFVVESLGSRVHSVHLAIDDVRDIAVLSGVTDTILAYVNRTTLYYRQLRDRFATEYELGGGWRQLYQIGMNNLLRFQFARSPEQPDRDPNLNYLLPASRAGKIAGFDSQGDAAFYEFVEPGIVGDQAPPLSRTKLVASNGQTYFLRNDGGAWQNQSVDITIEFYLDGVELRASRTYTFTADDQGRITRANTEADGDVAVDIVESGIGTRTYTGTFTPAEGGDGVTFNLVSVFGLPTTGEFTPNWNASGDYYGGGVVPTGAIHYTDYGAFATLRTVADGVFTARSATTRMRWPAGTLPEALRPASTRSYYCTVVNAGVTVAGAVQFETNGAAEFWPLEVADTRLVRGEFLRSITTVRQKGLPAEWQLTYAKAGPSLFAPIPVLDSITPDTVDRFDTGLTITLAGSGFRDNSEARLDGVPLNTTFNSSAELEADVPDAALEDAALYDITVFTPTPGGGQSAAKVLTVENPVPVLTSIDPEEVEDEQEDDLEITLTGTGFVPESVVELDGTPITTAYVSDTELTATIPEASLQTPDEFEITVVNPTPGGGTSEPATFTVTGAAPLVRTNLLQQRVNGTTSAFTPPDNSLLVVVQGVCQQSGSVDPSGNLTLGNSAGLTFTPRLTIGTAVPWSRGLRIWTAPVTTGASMTLTPGLSSGTVHTMDVHVFAYTGYDPVTPVGATASANNLASGGPRTITLSAAPDVNSEVLAVCHSNCTAAADPIDPTSPWVEQYDNGGANIQQQTQTRAGDTSTTVSWDDIGATFSVSNLGAAIEIRRKPEL